MPVWTLTPLDTSDHNWRASTWSKPVLVRAPDEQRAREIAKLAFGIATKREPSQDVPANPWGSPALVSAAVDPDQDDNRDGPEAILDPAEYDPEWRR